MNDAWDVAMTAGAVVCSVTWVALVAVVAWRRARLDGLVD